MVAFIVVSMQADFFEHNHIHLLLVASLDPIINTLPHMRQGILAEICVLDRTGFRVIFLRPLRKTQIRLLINGGLAVANVSYFVPNCFNNDPLI